MDFPFLKVIRGLLEADEYSFVFSRAIQLSSEVFSDYRSGIITKREENYILNGVYPAREWKHFPIMMKNELLSVVPTDCFFKKVEIDIPELGEGDYLFFPLETDTRDKLEIEGWFFISSDIENDTLRNREIFAFVDILREAIRNVIRIDKIKALTIIDDVTGLYNTRHLYSVLDQAVANSGRYFTEFSLIFLDVDHFKSINDNHGHLVGSKLLKLMGELLLANLRKVDLAFRYGGDEFVAFLPHTSKANATVVVKRLWNSLRTRNFVINDLELKLTGSFGVAGFPEDGNTVKEIIEKADMAMYDVKKKSRDGIQMA